jgi:hypothetical protein
LVDPHKRIISTANVPPQQLEWWADAVCGNPDAVDDSLRPELLHLLLRKPELRRYLEDRKSGDIRLPNEVLDLIYDGGVVPKNLMSVEEAKAHRLKLMKERSQFHDHAKEEWFQLCYNFCEH